MAETNEPSNAPSARTSLRKLLYIGLTLFIVWSVLGQLVPRLLFPHKEISGKEENSVITPLPAKEETAASNEQVTELKGRIAQLETKLQAFDEWQQHPASSVDNNRIAHLEDTLAKQQTQLVAVQSAFAKSEARAALIPLKDALDRGEPFDTALAQLSQLTQNRSDVQDALTQLKEYATDGVPPLGILQIQFQTLVPKALASAKDSNLLVRNLQSLIRIRKVGDQPGNSDEAALARAEAMLDRGDVSASLKNTSALSVDAKNIFSIWNDHAQAYLNAHEMLRNLQLALTAP